MASTTTAQLEARIAELESMLRLLIVTTVGIPGRMLNARDAEIARRLCGFAGMVDEPLPPRPPDGGHDDRQARIDQLRALRDHEAVRGHKDLVREYDEKIARLGA